MGRAHWHIFQVLTKRAERLRELAPHLTWAPNVWQGVPVENSRYLGRIDALRAVPATVRFLSRGALADAETAFTDALWTFASIDAVFEIARSPLDLARVAFAQGHDEAARTHVREAHRRFVQAEAPAYVRRAEQLAAERGVPLR